jgi:2',3'-cyclic-nucleotide 2'-phosphodiesterase (5'-nucleotidase family)
MRSLLVLPVLLLLLPGPASAQSSGNRATVKVLHFSNLEGEFASLGCSRDERGRVNIANFLYLVQEEARSSQALVVGSGNTLGNAPLLDFLLRQGESGLTTLSTVLGRAGAALFVPGFGELSIPYRMFLETAADLDRAGIRYRAANVKCEPTPSAACAVLTKQAASVVEVQGIRIGLIPLTDPRVAEVVHPGNAAGLSFQDPLATAKAEAARLRAEEKADVVIVVADLETEAGRIDRTMEFSRRVTGVDLVIAGGLVAAREDLPAVKEARVGASGVLLAGSPRASAALGVVTLKLVQKGTRWGIEGAEAAVKRVGSFRTLDDVAAILSQAVSEFCSLAPRVLGRGTLDPPMSRLQFMAYVTDVVRRELKAEVGFVSADTIQLDSEAVLGGPVTVGLLSRALARHELVLVRVSGSDLAGLLASYFASSNEALRLDLAIAGAEKGADGIVRINGREVNGARRYTIATTDFLASGGRSYLSAVLSSKGARKTSSKFFIQELLQRHFEHEIRFLDGEKPTQVSLSNNFKPLWTRPLWDVGFRLNAQFQNKSVEAAGHADQSQFVQAETTGLKGEGQLLVTMSTRDHRLAEFLSIQYGMTQVGDGDFEETRDLITEELLYAWTRLRNLRGKEKWAVPVPMIKGKLETEFTTPKAVETTTGATVKPYHHLELTGVAGFEWLIGPKATAGIAYGIRSEALAPEGSDRSGIEAGIQVYYTINNLSLVKWSRGGMTLDSRFELFYSDWGGDNTVKSSGNAKLGITLLGPLSFTAGIDVVLLYTSPDGLAYSVDTTIGLALALDAAAQAF